MLPNFRPKSPHQCPKLVKLADRQKAQLTSKQKVPTSDSSQDRQTTNHNIPITVTKMQVQAQKWSRPQETHRKIDIRSDWGDSDNGKDNQARGNPIDIDITSDQDTNMNQQPSTSNPST